MQERGTSENALALASCFALLAVRRQSVEEGEHANRSHRLESNAVPAMVFRQNT